MQKAAYVRNPTAGDGPNAWRCMAAAVAKEFETCVIDLVLLEQQQIYRVGRQKGDQNDLLELSGVVGAITTMWPEAILVGVKPREWKGQVDPDVMLRRIEGKLWEKEKGRVKECPKSLRHNVIDAIGLGMWWCAKKGLRP
jgi:hypothetical protein